MNFGGVKISYLNKYSENQSLEIELGDEFRTNNLLSDLSVFDLNNNKIYFDDRQFINNTSLKQNNFFAQGKYLKKLNKNGV
jgi:hypothetical protein